MIKISKLSRLFIIGSCLTLLVSGCLKKYNTTVALPEIGTAYNVIPGEIREEFDSKMDIYEGTNPPDITCSFVIAEDYVLYSSDGVTGKFSDSYMKFYNKKGNRYQYREKQNQSHSEASDVVVIGSGDRFTAYFTSNHVYEDGVTSCTTADLISGIMTTNGVRDIKHAFIMLDKTDPTDRLMDENEFRVFYDKDGLASFVNWDDTKTNGKSDVRLEGKSNTERIN